MPKEVERPKFHPLLLLGCEKQALQNLGLNLSMSKCGKQKMLRTLAKVTIEVEGQWYWYESWVKRCLELCEDAGDLYR